MATITAPVQFKLYPPARWLLIAATALAKHTPLRLPRGLVPFIVNRSWRMRIGDGAWTPVKIDATGKVVA
jgi:hypothetical protein